MMQTTSTIPIREQGEAPWVLPRRGFVGMACLILAESAIFLIFFVAYVYYIGKSLSGPLPAQVLELPILGTVCLLSSSATVHFAVSALRKGSLAVARSGCRDGSAGRDVPDVYGAGVVPPDP